jgi:hypothetical protein
LQEQVAARPAKDGIFVFTLSIQQPAPDILRGGFLFWSGGHSPFPWRDVMRILSVTSERGVGKGA